MYVHRERMALKKTPTSTVCCTALTHIMVPEVLSTIFFALALQGYYNQKANKTAVFVVELTLEMPYGSSSRGGWEMLTSLWLLLCDRTA